MTDIRKGDIVSIKGVVTGVVTYGDGRKTVDVHLDGALLPSSSITRAPEHLTLVERPKREFKVGATVRHTSCSPSPMHVIAAVVDGWCVLSHGPDKPPSVMKSEVLEDWYEVVD